MANAVEVADVLELWVWSNQQTITLSDLTSWLETAVPEQSLEIDTADLDNFDSDDGYELLAQETFEELQMRTKLLGTAYPFTCDGNRIRYVGGQEANYSYLFCLLLSHLPPAFITIEQRAAQFEGLAMRAAQSFFGGSAIRIGFPWETPSYADLLDRMRDLLPSLGPVILDGPVTSGDRGWDILVVKGFQDGLFPKFVALGNCATGKNDWLTKGAETTPEYLWQCFQSQRPGVYITFSAVPFNMDIDKHDRKSNRSHMTFDRHRICGLAPVLDPATSAWVQGQRPAAGDIAIDEY